MLRIFIQYIFMHPFLKIKKEISFIYYFERVEWKEKERETNINVWLPLTLPLLGTWSATQACALTWNGTGDPLVHRPALSFLSHTSQDTHADS